MEIEKELLINKNGIAEDIQHKFISGRVIRDPQLTNIFLRIALSGTYRISLFVSTSEIENFKRKIDETEGLMYKSASDKGIKRLTIIKDVKTILIPTVTFDPQLLDI